MSATAPAPAPPEAEKIVQPTSLATATPLFRRPFTPHAIKFKIQTSPKEKRQGGGHTQALMATYMDSRLVTERLNAICPGVWETAFGDIYQVGAKAGVVCRLKVYGITHEDVGFSDDIGTAMGMKALYSDALKRAAVQFGIGAYLYALPKSYVPASNLTLRNNGKWYINDQAEGHLRGKYFGWLTLEATLKRFGEALDHGDVADAQGDIDVTDPEHGDELPDADTAEAPEGGDAPPEDAVQTPEDLADRPTAEQIEELKILYADTSGLTAQVWQAQLVRVGVDQVADATLEQFGLLREWLQNYTPPTA